MKKLRVLLFSLLLAFFCAAGVSADAADPGAIAGSRALPLIVLILVLSVLLSSIGVAIFIIVRSNRRK